MTDTLSLDAVLRATGYVLPETGDVAGLLRQRSAARVDEPDAVWSDRTGVQIHFKFSASLPDLSEVFESRRHAWNTGTAALLWMVSPDRIDVYDAYARPKDREAEEAFLLRTFGAVEQELARLDAYAGRLAIESGRFLGSRRSHPKRRARGCATPRRPRATRGAPHRRWPPKRTRRRSSAEPCS